MITTWTLLWPIINVNQDTWSMIINAISFLSSLIIIIISCWLILPNIKARNGYWDVKPSAGREAEQTQSENYFKHHHHQMVLIILMSSIIIIFIEMSTRVSIIMFCCCLFLYKIFVGFIRGHWFQDNSIIPQLNHWNIVKLR